MAKTNRAAAAALEALSKERLDFYLACYLIGAQPYSYFQYGWGFQLSMGALVDYKTLRKPLGSPLGPYKRTSPNGWEFTREFEHASVWVDTEKREGKIRWDADSMIAVLDSGNIWYHNYYPGEFNAPFIKASAGTFITSEENPSDTLNPSPLVSKFVRNSESPSFIKFGLPVEIRDLSRAIFKIRIYAPTDPSTGNDSLELVLRKDDQESGQISLSKEITKGDEWVEYTFDLSEDSVIEGYYNNIYLYFKASDAENRVYYIDAFQGPLEEIVHPLQLSFTVYSDKSGNVLSDIPVTMGEKEIQTGGNGVATFELLQGSYEYSISHPDFFSTTDVLELTKDTSILIILAAKKASIKFRIYAGDKPLYNARLDMDEKSLNTNQTGITLFQDLTRFEEYAWSASKEGYEELAGTVSLLNDTTLNLSMNLLTKMEDYGSQGLTFYPNPVQSRLFFESEESIRRIEVCDTRAAVFSHQDINKKKASIDMSNYPDGIYFIKLYRNGHGPVSIKILKSE